MDSQDPFDWLANYPTKSPPTNIIWAPLNSPDEYEEAEKQQIGGGPRRKRKHGAEETAASPEAR